ncbi:hypothetical protein [Candidatus Amarolinea dominans]|uniref:hypothetical protein n=1 Tax=Candidatus Amarolinea dominans TaxID=3140696 RepID=UPI001D7B0EC3|nr:hypothetical protein [Anaerolineae bacterium]
MSPLTVVRRSCWNNNGDPDGDSVQFSRGDLRQRSQRQQRLDWQHLLATWQSGWPVLRLPMARQGQG